MKFYNYQVDYGPPLAWCRRRRGGFSRVDLLASILGLVLLCFWFGWTHFGERGRIAKCAGNLAMLGRATQGYANEHENMLPAANIWLQKASISWDSKLFPYVEPGLAKSSNDKLFAKGEKFFFCPSDPAPHSGVPRSYAMSANDMSRDNWPPGPRSATGLGLWWDGNTTPPLLGEDAKNHPETLPSVKLSDLAAPADTLLLTEFIDPQNLMGSVFRTTVQSVIQQQGYFKGHITDFHRGRFNYLMADGHVELLSELQTGSPDGHAGIWTIKKDD